MEIHAKNSGIHSQTTTSYMYFEVDSKCDYVVDSTIQNEIIPDNPTKIPVDFHIHIIMQTFPQSVGEG